jgi:hypothetical protein
MSNNNSRNISSISMYSGSRCDDKIMELPIWVALGLAIMCIAGVWYMFKAQDRYIERLKRDRDGDTSLHV